MNPRLMKLREDALSRVFRTFRKGEEKEPGRWAFRGSRQRRATELFKLRCSEETPIVLPDERISYMRSRKCLAWCSVDHSPVSRFFRRVRSLPDGLKRRFMPTLVHPAFPRTQRREVYNTTPNYSLLLRDGLEGRLSVARNRLAVATTPKEREFLTCAIEGMEAFLELAERYTSEARRMGNAEAAEILSRIPRAPSRSFHEALQAVRILNFACYLHGMSHCGLGRIDQYLFPFYEKDIQNGVIGRVEAKELLAEFLISFNRDSDLYPGVQQGDNGQSLMLGGCKPESGECAVNELTYLVMEAALETRLIDPKINLRIDHNTPLDLLELGCELTKYGLGFPQYSNDEVVIPALVKKGYSLEDARNYSVAACWEFIVPGKSMDMVNQGALSFPYVVDAALREAVRNSRFDECSFKMEIRHGIREQVARIVALKEDWYPAPFLSAFFDESLESGKDITELSLYRNIGIHGAGAANAADSIAAIKEIFATDGMPGLCRLVRALDHDFSGEDGFLARLCREMPKVGNADKRADAELKFLFDVFADVADELSSPGCVIRPGSGSAMFYIWLTEARNPRTARMMEPVVGATADGRRLNAPLSSSLAPTNEAQVAGVFSVLKSFSKIDYSRIMNGGPITLEFSHTIFRTSEGTRKLAQLIRYFVDLGGQQLQLNVLNVAELEDALVHPERHRNLVVRVWGWSGYFCELDREFQMQIIKRHCYGS